MKFANTFSTMRVGSFEVKNRLAMAAMGSHMANADGTMNEISLNYYRHRSLGGFGIITTEIAQVDIGGKSDYGEIDVSMDSSLPGLTRLADACKEGGALSLIQLHHAGRQTAPDRAGKQPISPSSIPCPMNRSTPKEMTREEIYILIDQYIDAGMRAQKAGFHGVEIHGAHGYMGAQFLSKRSNKRVDEFGGDLEGRARFLKLIIQGIREKCGQDFVICIRISANEYRVGGSVENEIMVQAKMLEDYGADIISVSTGTFGCWENILPTSDYSPAWNLDAVSKIKRGLKIPVIAVGAFNDTNMIEQAIARGDCDFVALGRQSIADPYFPNKMMTGNLDEITPCMTCNQRCMVVDHNDPSLLEGDHGLSCSFNPQSNHRADVELVPTEAPKKILVVGAGPAGLEFAGKAALRGHDVTVYEKNPEYSVGGQLKIAAYPPHKQSLARAIKHKHYMCKKYGVDFVYDKEVTADFIREQKPDAVVIATGAVPIMPPIKGIDGPNVKRANDVLLGELVDGRVLVLGGGLVGVETAEYCTDYCTGISIVEMLPDIVPGMHFTNKTGLLKRFKEDGIDVHVNTKVKEITDDGIIGEFEGQEIVLEGYDSIIAAFGAKAYNPLANSRDLAKEVYTIGDAVKARDVYTAIYEAFRLAQKI